MRPLARTSMGLFRVSRKACADKAATMFNIIVTSKERLTAIQL